MSEGDLPTESGKVEGVDGEQWSAWLIPGGKDEYDNLPSELKLHVRSLARRPDVMIKAEKLEDYYEDIESLVRKKEITDSEAAAYLARIAEKHQTLNRESERKAENQIILPDEPWDEVQQKIVELHERPDTSLSKSEVLQQLKDYEKKRGMYREAAKKRGVLNDIRSVVANREEAVKQGAEFPDMINDVAVYNVDNLENSISHSSDWDSKFSGMIKDYRDVAILVMNYALNRAEQYRAAYFGDNEAHLLLETEGDQLAEEIAYKSWGTIPGEVYGIAQAYIERKIKQEEERTPIDRGLARREPIDIDILPPLLVRTPRPIHIASAEERAVFGGQDAFTQRWTRTHGFADALPPNPYQGITQAVYPNELLSEVLETGISDAPTAQKVGYVINSAPEKNFRIAANTGFLPTLMLDRAMESNRIDTPAATMEQRGFTPQGVAQWLIADLETRRALRLIFELQGYDVAPERDSSGRIINDRVSQTDIRGLPDFADFTLLDSNKKMVLRASDIDQYLKAVQRGVTVSNTETGEATSTDWGVVRVAYTIFRSLGFGHGNTRIAEQLAGKYTTRYGGDLVAKFDGQIRDVRGKIIDTDIAPIVDKFRDPRDPSGNTYLVDVLRTEGILGFAVALNEVPAETIRRYWGDWQLIVDGMDKLYDIRSGIGGAVNMHPEARVQAVAGIQELNVAAAKRKFSDATEQRILDPNKVSTAPPAGQPTQRQRAAYSTRSILTNIFPFLKPRRPKSYK